MDRPQGCGLARAAGLALAPLVALGFTRFAYALVLPPMQAGLGWNLAQAGALNTANAAGFLFGALTAPGLARRFGAAPAFVAALVLSALALLATAALDDWASFLGLRAIGGVGTAWAFVLGAALAPRALPQRPGLALTLYFGGTGLGMVLAGLGWSAAALQDWRLSWLAMGALAVAVVVVGAVAVRGLALPRITEASRRGPRSGLAHAMGPTLAANALYGAGYVGYTTFVIALLSQRGWGASAGGWVFGLIGLSSMLASPVWGPWLERRAGGRGFAVINALLAVALVPVLLSEQLGVVLASATLFGAVFMAGPAAVGLVAQRELPATELARGLGALTAAFSIGQAVGPLLTAWAASASGRLEAGLWLGPLLLLAGSAVSLAQGGRRRS